MNSRDTALKILKKIETDGAYSNIALKDVLGTSKLDTRDRAFVTNLVYGVVSRKLTLDYIISKYSSVKLKKISEYVLLILRMGIYQIIYMDKVPASAAVNECVKLSNKYAHRSTGFVNGILRSVVRAGDVLENVSDLSIKYSFPKSICDMFTEQLGEKRAESVMCALNSHLDVTIRANSLKISTDELVCRLSDECDAKSVSDLPHAVLVSGLDVAQSESYRDGYFTVQGIAAQLSVMALGIEPGQSIIDMCAAPGGKTTYMAELTRSKGKVIAFDIHKHKIDLIEKNIKRLGITNAYAELSDGCILRDEYIGTADRILCDVPCSGLGIISKKPDIKWSYKDSQLQQIQKKILTNASRYLKSGGELVYSTCTINRAENEDVINTFLAENEGYSLCDFSHLLPERFNSDTPGYKTLYPDTDKTDGFFIAKIRKN